MIERRIVRRYAAALFAGASKAGLVDRIESDLGLVSYTLESSPDLLDALGSPLVSESKKCEILRAIFEGKLDAITLSYLDLLVRHRREQAMAQTEREYVAIANEARGVVTARVVSAVELTADERERLRLALGRVTGGTVQLSAELDPQLIGGLFVRIGDTIIDGSIRGRLAALREQMLS